MDRKKYVWTVLLILAVALSGCAGKQAVDTSAADAAAAELKAKQDRISQLEDSLRSTKAELASAGDAADCTSAVDGARRDATSAAEARCETMLADARKSSGSGSYVSAGAEMLPPNAKPGECYARVFVPPTFGTSTEKVLVREESERVSTLPAKYESGSEKVLAKEASARIEVVPASYKWVEEKILSKPASTRLEEVPATYDWAEEKILVTPARTIWKEGRGAIERVDDSTGEIMCLVEEPAVYKTVRRKVVKTPAKTRTVEIPAEYKTVKRQVVDKPATTRTIEIPAEYKTVDVRKLVSPASEKRTTIPAEYSTVTKTVQKTDGSMEWREILCQTNMTANTVRNLQRALQKAGYNPGPVDGVYGYQTKTAVAAYQKKKGLATGGLTMSTLKALGVQI